MRYAFCGAVQCVFLIAGLVNVVSAETNTSLSLAADVPAQKTQSGKDSSAPDSTSELAKKTQNPVSDLISVPIENLFGFGAGADGELSYPGFPRWRLARWHDLCMFSLLFEGFRPF